MTAGMQGVDQRGPRHPRKGRWVVWLLAAMMAGLSSLLWKCSSISRVGLDSNEFTNGFQSPEMAAAQFSAKDVVGDLGGMPVKIPRHFANYVEYEGDPGWGEKRKGPVPPRTHASKLKSFGFDVRVPDMAGLSSPEMGADKRAQTIYNTMWIGVGVNTGPIYPGDGFLDRRANYINSKEPGGLRYRELPQPQHGLIVYVPEGINPGTNPLTQRQYQESSDRRDTDDIFLHRTLEGRVDAYIRCSNVGHAAAPCRHDFSMEPYAKAKVYVSYRRGMLANWQQIQESVTRLLVGFKAPMPEPAASGR